MTPENGVSNPWVDIGSVYNEILLTRVEWNSDNIVYRIGYKVIGDASGMEYRSKVDDPYTTGNILDALWSMGDKETIEKFLAEEKPRYLSAGGGRLIPFNKTRIDDFGVTLFPTDGKAFSFRTFYREYGSDCMEHFYFLRYFTKEWFDNHEDYSGYKEREENSNTILSIKRINSELVPGGGCNFVLLMKLLRMIDDYLKRLCKNPNEEFILCFIPSHDQIEREENAMARLLGLHNSLYKLPDNIHVENCLLKRETGVTANHMGGNRVETPRSIIVNHNYRQMVRNKHIIVMDDVMTTGRTVSHASMILSSAGARHVTCVTLSKSYK